MTRNLIAFKGTGILIRILGLVFRTLVLGFLGFELIALQTFDVNASEPFKIQLPDTIKNINEIKQKFGADTDAFYENLPKGVWLDENKKRVLVVAVVKDQKAKPRDLEFLLLSDIDDLILSHIGKIPKYDLKKIPFKSAVLRKLSEKLAYQYALAKTREYKTRGTIPFRRTQDGNGKQVFEISLELFSKFIQKIESKVNGPNWNMVRGDIFRSLFHDRNFKTLSKILEAEARIFDILLVKELLDQNLRTENGFDLNNRTDPIKYAKKILFSYGSDLAFAGPPTSIIKPMLKGHRFFDSFYMVVSRLPVATAPSAKTALGIIRKPLENIQGGRELYDIITRSYRGALPQNILSKVEKTGAYVVKYVANTAGFVFLSRKPEVSPRGSLDSSLFKQASENELLLSIAKAPAKPGPYFQLAKILKDNGNPLTAIAFLHFALRKAPGDIGVRHELAYAYYSMGAYRLAEGMAKSVIYDDVKNFFPKAPQNPDWEEIEHGAQRIIKKIRNK